MSLALRRPAALSAALLACGAGSSPGGTGPAPVLDGVQVTPASLQLQAGDSALFNVTGHRSDGSTVAVTVGWSATGGSVSASGVYHAPAGAGSYAVIAATTDGRFADTALVTVTLTPPPPPPAGTVLLTEGFDDAAVGARGWYDNTAPIIATSGQHGGAGALEMAWQAGATLPAHGGSMRHSFAGSDRVYARYWVRYSANYVGSGQTYHPHEFHFITDQDPAYVGPSTTHLTTYIEINYQNGGIPVLATTDVSNIDVTKINQDLTTVTEHRAVSGCNGNSDGYPTSCYQGGTEWRNEKKWKAAQPMFTPSAGPGYQGDWHKVEVYFQLNSIQGGVGQNDGIAQYWFDGQLVINKQNVLFRTADHPTMKFVQFLIAPYIGDGSPVAQSMWVDDLVIATGPVP